MTLCFVYYSILCFLRQYKNFPREQTPWFPQKPSKDLHVHGDCRCHVTSHARADSTHSLAYQTEILPRLMCLFHFLDHLTHDVIVSH